jgi:hypothetical protein
MRLKYLSDSDSAHKHVSQFGHIHEREILALIGRSRCHFPIGMAARWLPNDSPALRRVAEFVGDIVFPSLGEALARRIATASIRDVQQQGASSPVEIIAGAIGHAVDLTDAQAVQLRQRLTAITRHRKKLPDVAAVRKTGLKKVRRLRKMIATLRQDIARDEVAFRRNKQLLRLVQLGKTRDLPRAERALAAAQASLPVYRLGAAARRTRDELQGRLRQLRACRRALTDAGRTIVAKAARSTGSVGHG